MAIDLTTMEQRQVAVVEGLLERESEITVAPDNRTLHLKTCRQSGSRGIRGGGQMPMYECKNIVAVDIMTGQQTKLFTASEDDLISHFAFSPDMRQMAVIVNNQDSTRFRLLLMRADGKDIHDLGQHEPGGRIQSVWGPFWSPDGASITVRRMVGALDLFTERLQISVDGRHSGWQPFTDAGLSPDGAHVASEVDRPSITVREVWALDNVSAFLKTAR
jgi:hypothetical protein